MREIVREVRLTEAFDDRTAAAPRARQLPLDALTVTLFVVGLVPLIGFAWRHAWDARELGLAAIMVLLAGRELVRYVAASLRRARDARS